MSHSSDWKLFLGSLRLRLIQPVRLRKTSVALATLASAKAVRMVTTALQIV